MKKKKKSTEKPLACDKSLIDVPNYKGLIFSGAKTKRDSWSHLDRNYRENRSMDHDTGVLNKIFTVNFCAKSINHTLSSLPFSIATDV